MASITKRIFAIMQGFVLPIRGLMFSFCKSGFSSFVRNVLAVIASASFALCFTGCDKNSKTAGADSSKIRVGYIGLTCEAPIFTAVEKGFFKDEGLDVELVQCQWANYKDVLALGGYDITHHLVMYFLKPIEQGLDVKFTGGIH